jgi:tetratricopeptide (TPR) repeat protein
MTVGRKTQELAGNSPVPLPAAPWREQVKHRVKRLPTSVYALLTFLAVIFGVFPFFTSFSFPPFTETVGPEGAVLQKATRTGFEQEVREEAEELAARAAVHFEAAEEDYNASRYQDAADQYQKSIAILPTVSASLNRGNALYSISAFSQAEPVYLGGLQLARKRGRQDFEANFLTNIGNVYWNQGKYADALASYQPAQAFFKQLGNPLGQTQTLTNIGNVYADQEKKTEGSLA